MVEDLGDGPCLARTLARSTWGAACSGHSAAKGTYQAAVPTSGPPHRRRDRITRPGSGASFQICEEVFGITVGFARQVEGTSSLSRMLA